MTLAVRTERWSTAAPFQITGQTWTEIEVIVVEVRRHGYVGCGEAFGVYYRGETAARMTEQVRDVADRVIAGCDQTDLLELLPAGGARNAIDCALWDLRAQVEDQPVWSLAGLPSPRPLLTTYTLGASEPDVMAQGARGFAGAKALKLKLLGDDLDAARVEAVRAARPDVWMGVDANQGCTAESLARLMPALQAANVQLLEQPFRVGDPALDDLKAPMPVAADESVQDIDDLPGVSGRVEVVNIKLDKCGGLTRALQLAARARALGLRPMVGNMLGTSLSIAPAYLLGQLCEVVDLDGPLLLAADRPPAATYDAGYVCCPAAAWGVPRPRGAT